MKTIQGNLLDQRGVLCQQVNCRGVMGAGLAAQFASRWPEMVREYHEYIRAVKPRGYPLLGKVHYYQPSEDVIVANLFGQNWYGTEPGRVYTDYGALREALIDASGKARLWGMQLYIPVGMGCGLAGGTWSRVVDIIEEVAPEAILVQL